MIIHWKKEKIRENVITHARSNRITARRMISIQVAENFTYLRPNSQGRAHFLKGNDYDGMFAIDLEDKGNGKRLICKPFGNFKINNGVYIEDTITEIEVLKIEDYH